jgi:predicted HicB family RNase H-like nuclease
MGSKIRHTTARAYLGRRSEGKEAVRKMKKNKMLQARVNEAFHNRVTEYAEENRRSVQKIILNALRYYMKAHPILADPGEEEVEA